MSGLIFKVEGESERKKRQTRDRLSFRSHCSRCNRRQIVNQIARLVLRKRIV